MDKKTLVIIFLTLTLLSLNICVAQDVDGGAIDDVNASDDTVLKLSDDSQPYKQDTHLDVKSNITFDAVGEYFKVKLSDDNGTSIGDTKVAFSVNGKTYNQKTNSKGIASLQINLKDGTYDIVTKFKGNSRYNPSNLTTTIKMNNTRVVDSGLSSSEIQNILDNAKANNVILFKGSSYSKVNLVITKSLTLISDVGTTLKSSSSKPVITIKGKSASLTKIKGFNIQGDGDGIEVNGADFVTVYKNNITTKGNGILAKGTKYINITKNNLVKNSKNGISIADSSDSYIFNNKINENNQNAILASKTNNLYVHGNTMSNNKLNGFYLAKSIDGVSYGESENVYLTKNTISKNFKDAIIIANAGDNVNIKSNSIVENRGNGISISKIGDNSIQSNVISDNWENGIQFFDNYVKPSNQEISYNAIFSNLHMDVEAKDTYYQENGERLEVGDNWYTDYEGVCPKIKTSNMKFTVKQIGPNKYQATFFDSNGNIAALLPDRTLTYTTNNGEKVKVSINGGAGVFTVDAKDGDIVKAVVDHSQRDNVHDLNTKTTKEIIGKSPEYTYPPIPGYGGGNGNGKGNGQGSGGNTGKGNGNSPQESSDNTGNSTHSQDMDPSNSGNNPVNDVSQSESVETTSQASASDVGRSNDADSGSQSVVKQIIIDEDEFFKVTGISFIILLIVLTIGFYYREDIKEMKSKL